MNLEMRRAARMAMRGVPERLGLSFAQGNIEMRGKPNGTGGTAYTWEGYATAFDFEFPMWDENGEPFKERVAPGSATRTLSNPHLDTPFLIGHNSAGIPLARTKSGTMQLSQDSHGVLTYVPSMDGGREEVRALYSAQQRGDIDEMSMAFVCTRQSWDPSFEQRTILEIDLHRGDVCAVTHGANVGTAGSRMYASEQLSCRRPASIGGPRLIEARMPTEPYTVHPDEDNGCPQCQSMNDRDAYFCDQCGTKMPGGPVGEAVAETDGSETHQCQSCLSMNATDAKYCDQCGAGLAGVTPWRIPGGGYSGDYASGRPVELRASAAEDADLTAAPDTDAAAAAHVAPCKTCGGNGQLPHPLTGMSGVTCPGCHGSGAVVTVDDATGIPGDEVQMSAARKLELRLRELDLEELALR